MTFSNDKTPSIRRYFLSQPHQPLFVMGIVHSIVGMLLFMLAYKGVLALTIDATLFHAYWMIFIVFTHFFHGFLLTTFPRFCMAQAVPQRHYVRMFALYQSGALLFLVGAIFFPPIAVVGVLAIFAGHLMTVSHLRAIYLVGGAPDKKDAFWLLVAHALGLFSHLVFVVGLTYAIFGYPLLWFSFGAQLATWGYLIFLAFVVAQRMIPFFSHVMIQKPDRFIAIVFALLVLKALANTLALGWIEIALTLAAAIYLGYEIFRWRLPIFSSPAILWVLHLALFWLPIALLLDAITQTLALVEGTDFIFAGLHLALLGFLTTVLIGFGTRVTLGHSGQVPHADRFSTALFWLTQLVVLTRFAYSITIGFGLNLAWLFDLSATLWIVLFCAWGIKFGPTLIFGKR